jgi:GalNAc-alpha-(1->4)-GalNAc-alpha-(1->3)-diNAcBac-PP-undecaprenol alpha-1,4-N-acetyl-D-galactosaminyltransferase
LLLKHLMKNKIVFLITSLNSGGAERNLVNLINSFSSKYEVHLILFYNEPKFYKLDKEIVIYHLNDKYSPSKNVFQSVKQNISFLRKIIAIFKSNKYNLVISFTTNVNILSILAAKYLSVPCIISERNNPEVYVPNTSWRILRNLSYPFSNGLIVQTDLIKSFYQKIVPQEKIIVIPNPIAENLYSLRKTYNERQNIILTVGRIDANKNQRILIEAFANLNTENWKLIIAGDGVLKEEYKKLTETLGIAAKVDFVGNVQNIWDYYNQAKIFAFTSNSEGFPNALLEAMSFGLPCVSTDCPSGPSEIIVNDENGYLTELNNKEHLEKSLSKLISNPEICNQFSQNAIKYTQKFSLLEIKKLWEIQIQKLL